MTLRKVLLTALILAVVALPLTANATITRVIGLGGTGANYVVRDAYNTSVWPQLIKHYGQQAGAEFNGALQKAYINYDFGDDKSVLNIALDRSNTRSFGWGDPDFNPLAGLDGIEGGYNRLNLMYGRPMGEGMLIGAALTFGGKSYSQDAVDEAFPMVPEVDDSYAEFGGRIGVTALEEKLDFAAGLTFGGWSTKLVEKELIGGDTLPYTYENESDGAVNLNGALRYWHEFNDDYAIIPSARMDIHTDGSSYSFTEPVSNDNPPPDYVYETQELKAKTSSVDLRLGVGNNWTPKDNMLAIFEVGLLISGETIETEYFDIDNGELVVKTDEGTNSTADIFWRLGIESEIFSWLNGRFGAERAWRGRVMEYPVDSGDPTYGTSVTMTYLGASMHWNRFVADVLVNPSFIGYGPNFISGYNDMIFTQASLKINFDKE